MATATKNDKKTIGDKIEKAFEIAIASDHSKLILDESDRFMGSCRVYVEILGFTKNYQEMFGEITPFHPFNKKVAPLIEKACNKHKLIFRYKVGSLVNAIYCGYRNGREETQVRKALALSEALHSIGLNAFVEYEAD